MYTLKTIDKRLTIYSMWRPNYTQQGRDPTALHLHYRTDGRHQTTAHQCSTTSVRSLHRTSIVDAAVVTLTAFAWNLKMSIISRPSHGPTLVQSLKNCGYVLTRQTVSPNNDLALNWSSYITLNQSAAALLYACFQKSNSRPLLAMLFGWVN